MKRCASYKNAFWFCHFYKWIKTDNFQPSCLSPQGLEEEKDDIIAIMLSRMSGGNPACGGSSWSQFSCTQPWRGQTGPWRLRQAAQPRRTQPQWRHGYQRGGHIWPQWHIWCEWGEYARPLGRMSTASRCMFISGRTHISHRGCLQVVNGPKEKDVQITTLGRTLHCHQRCMTPPRTSIFGKYNGPF